MYTKILVINSFIIMISVGLKIITYKANALAFKQYEWKKNLKVRVDFTYY